MTFATELRHGYSEKHMTNSTFNQTSVVIADSRHMDQHRMSTSELPSRTSPNAPRPISWPTWYLRAISVAGRLCPVLPRFNVNVTLLSSADEDLDLTDCSFTMRTQNETCSLVAAYMKAENTGKQFRLIL